MKKGVLILLGMFMMVSTVEAKNGDENLNYRVDYSYNNAVNFFENGIEFFVFTNGDFDFDTYGNNRQIRIDRDFRGRIKRINNTTLSYDIRGNVSRIGNVYMRYFRNRLTRVGQLRVDYDRWGNPIFDGQVRDYYYDNGIRFSINFGDVFSYHHNFFNHRDFRSNYIQIREDRNFYYYRARPNAKIGKRSSIIKRRKPAATVRKNDNIRRKSNTTYRKNNVDKRATSTKNNRYSNKNTERTQRSNANISRTQRKVDTARKTKNAKGKTTTRNTNAKNKKLENNNKRSKRG